MGSKYRAIDESKAILQMNRSFKLLIIITFSINNYDFHRIWLD